ncbi:MAG: hypothetical protein Kow0037_30730 [Calditrichia bacterium]
MFSLTPQQQAQISQYKLENNWLAIHELLEPLVKPGQPAYTDVDVLSEYGFALSQLGQYAAAENMYRRWIELQPQSARAHYCLGYVYYLQEDWEDAVNCFEYALSLFPNYLVCLYRYGYALSKWNKTERAVEPLKKVLEIYRTADDGFRRRNGKNYVKARYLLAKVLLEMGDSDGAQQHMRLVLQEDSRNYVKPEFKNFAMGKILMAKKEHQQAREYLIKALNRRFPQPYILDFLGRVSQALNDYPQAESWYNKALAVRQMPYILYDRARLYHAMGESAKAMEDAHQGIKRDKKGAHKGMLLLAQICLENNRLDEAEQYCRQAIDWKLQTYQSDFAEAHYQLARIYQQKNDPELVRQEMQTALMLNPNLEWDADMSAYLQVEGESNEPQPEWAF